MLEETTMRTDYNENDFLIAPQSCCLALSCETKSKPAAFLGRMRLQPWTVIHKQKDPLLVDQYSCSVSEKSYTSIPEIETCSQSPITYNTRTLCGTPNNNGNCTTTVKYSTQSRLEHLRWYPR